MRMQVHEWKTGTRPCDYSICFPEGAVISDFSEDEDGQFFLERMSFDGFGCYRLGSDSGVTKISQKDSELLKEAIACQQLETLEVEEVLLRYFRENAEVIGREPLDYHKFI